MVFKIPTIIGHRGACAYAPENTLDSIRTAAEMGVEWVELDVMLTKDQVPVIFHDDTLDRTTNGYGPLAEKTWDDLRDLDAGSWFADSFTSARIPTLEDAVDEITRLGLGLNLEIKPAPGHEKETAEVALDLLSRIWDDGDRLLISSFSHVSLEVAADMAHEWRRGLLLDAEWPENWQQIADYLEVSTINIDGRACDRNQVEAIIDFGKPVLAYTINDPQRARILQSWGVDAFFTNVPDVLKEALFKIH